MTRVNPETTFDHVHLPLRAPKLSGQCATAIVTQFDLEFTVNVGFMGYGGDATPDDIRMALKNLGGLIHAGHTDRAIAAWDELPRDEVALVAMRHQSSFYWIVWNPYALKSYFDPSLLSPSKVLPQYLQDVRATPTLYLPVYF